MAIQFAVAYSEVMMVVCWFCGSWQSAFWFGLYPPVLLWKIAFFLLWIRVLTSLQDRCDGYCSFFLPSFGTWSAISFCLASNTDNISEKLDSVYAHFWVLQSYREWKLKLKPHQLLFSSHQNSGTINDTGQYISRVSNQISVSQAWYIVEIHHSGQEPSISTLRSSSDTAIYWTQTTSLTKRIV